MANVANNLLMLGLIYYRRKLFEIQAFHNQAHIINFTGIIIYFWGTYYLYADIYLLVEVQAPTGLQDRNKIMSMTFTVFILL